MREYTVVANYTHGHTSYMVTADDVSQLVPMIRSLARAKKAELESVDVFDYEVLEKYTYRGGELI